ncbi:MAG: hypothetical protein HYY93_15415, partial [Planctomycetes bacterium]|nr:hypothetical protein [Planctomycetota bacterium]
MVRAAYVLIGVFAISSLLFVFWVLQREPRPLSPRTTHHPPPEPPRTGVGTEPASPLEVESPSPPPSGKRLWDPALGSASISGIVLFSGTPPIRARIDMSGSPECMHWNRDDPPFDEDLIVINGKLANAFVWVRKGLEEWEFPAPSTPVVLNQRECRYVPHVLGIQV